jgi:hypothetical protein
VVGPARSRDVDTLAMRIESLEEGGCNSQGSSAGNRLSDGDSVFLESRRVFAVGEDGSCFGEAWDTGDSWKLISPPSL